MNDKNTLDLLEFQINQKIEAAFKYKNQAEDKQNEDFRQGQIQAFSEIKSLIKNMR